jgi:hypothetical protein
MEELAAGHQVRIRHSRSRWRGEGTCLQQSGKRSPSQNYSGERKEEPVAGLAGKKTKKSVFNLRILIIILMNRLAKSLNQMKFKTGF